MEKLLLLIFVIGVTSLLVGCSDLLGNDKQDRNVEESKTIQYADKNANPIQYIIVQKRIGDEHKYENIKQMNADENEQLSKVNDLLAGIKWESAKVDMVRPPDYQFRIKYNQSNSPLYTVWISPNHDKLEVVIGTESKYVQLDEATSSELFQMLTDKKLSDIK